MSEEHLQQLHMMDKHDHMCVRVSAYSQIKSDLCSLLCPFTDNQHTAPPVGG